MSGRKHLDELMKRLHVIEQETGGKEKDEKCTEEQLNADPFIRLKQEIGRLERETRNDIKARDEYAENAATKNDGPEIVKQTTAIKQKVKELRAKSSELRGILGEQMSKMKKGTTNEGIKNRKKMCDLIDARIDEVDRYARGLSFVSAKNDPNRQALLKDADDEDANPVLATYTPSGPTESEFQEIEGYDDWQLMVNKNEELIDEKLDQILDATSLLVHTANNIQEEYRTLGAMIDVADEKMNKQSEKLDSANEQVAKTLDKIAGGKNCCLDIFLLVVILACIYFIVTQFVTF